MNYFITSRQDLLTSSIEKAQVQRLKVFDALHQPATIVTLLYNTVHLQVERKLGITGRVINLYQYFQKLPYQEDSTGDQQLASRLLHQPGYEVQDDEAFLAGKRRIKLIHYQQRLYSASYYDRFGFLDRTDYYDCGCLSYTDFFEDKGRKVVRQYYDHHRQVIISYYYRGGKGNFPVLTLIQLNHHGKLHNFDSEAAFRSYFLDELVKNDLQAALISDRSDAVLTAFQLMQQQVPRYQVFHSVFTVDGQLNSKIFDVYQPLNQMFKNHQLQGVISSTVKEAADVQKRFATTKSYAIPVTYLTEDLLTKSISFDQRRPGQIIAVARLSAVKRLDHLIDTVILLHKKFSFVTLKIYGYDENLNNYATSKSLKKIVRDHHAEDYIQFCGYLSDLSSVYETADLEVLTSSFEGFAMALLEAEGHACPVVSYDINYGPAEIIADGRNGRLVPVGDQHTLYKILAQLLSSRETLRQYSNNAQVVARKYAFDQVQKRWRHFLIAENLWQTEEES